MTAPLFSICIPNFNYERYISTTIQSVLEQQLQNFEICVSDNASSDASVELVRALQDSRIRLSINRCNVGFAGNLDRAALLATGDFMIMLSSDDVIYPAGLSRYSKFLSLLGQGARSAVFSSTWDVIDADGSIVGESTPDPELWRDADRDSRLEQELGIRVYSVDAGELLSRCLLSMKNPFNFAATCYPRGMYERVEGYGGGRVMNPDKWFHWKLLSVAGKAYLLDEHLFAYRNHANNQLSQQATTRSLKYMVDEYLTSLEVSSQMRARSGVTSQAVIEAFIERDVGRHGLATLGRGDRHGARRIERFGSACYPSVAKRSLKIWLLWCLLLLGPVGTLIARIAYRRHLKNSTTFVARGVR